MAAKWPRGARLAVLATALLSAIAVVAWLALRR
jgi:hypothetical protein